jgi:hypothetical protein
LLLPKRFVSSAKAASGISVLLLPYLSHIDVPSVIFL